MTDLHAAPTQAPAGLRGLLTDIIDYAGIFPPACLSLDEALENFAEYRRSSAAWMLGRFVVPSGMLPDLEKRLALFEKDPPLRLSVLVANGNDAATFLGTLESDLSQVAMFVDRHEDAVAVGAFEMRLPDALLGTDVVEVGRFVSSLVDLFDRYQLRRPGFFIEIPLDANCRQTVTIAAGAVHAVNREKADDQGTAGLKMRTGGTQASAIPPANRVAEFIVASSNAGVPFKATAGLHHPVRHFDETLGAEMHGFLNVFVAAVAASADHVDESDLLPILLEEDAGAFAFSGDEIRWRELRLPVDDVVRARRDRAISFGSCSFAEPVDDLTALGLL